MKANIIGINKYRISVDGTDVISFKPKLDIKLCNI